jgi:hypothetical protein
MGIPFTKSSHGDPLRGTYVGDSSSGPLLVGTLVDPLCWIHSADALCRTLWWIPSGDPCGTTPWGRSFRDPLREHLCRTSGETPQQTPSVRPLQGTPSGGSWRTNVGEHLRGSRSRSPLKGNPATGPLQEISSRVSHPKGPHQQSVSRDTLEGNPDREPPQINPLYMTIQWPFQRGPPKRHTLQWAPSNRRPTGFPLQKNSSSGSTPGDFSRKPLPEEHLQVTHPCSSLQTSPSSRHRPGDAH